MQVHFANIWQAIADEVGDRTALIHGDERVSWREHDDQAARLAQAFIELGLQPDSKVALYLYNGIEYVDRAVRGVQDPRRPDQRQLPLHATDELLYLLDNSDAEVLVLPLEPRRPCRAGAAEGDEAPGGHRGRRWWPATSTARCGGTTSSPSHEPAARIEGQPDDIYMLYTGGTTGMPKGVMYTHGIFPIALGGFGAAIYGPDARRPTSTSSSRSATSSTAPPVWLAGVPADARHGHVARHDGAAAAARARW